MDTFRIAAPELNPTRQLLWCTLTSVFLSVLLFTDSPVIADTILFSDLTENVFITTTSTRVSDVSCGTNSLSEFCLLTLNPPSPTAILLSPPATIGIAEAGSTSGSDEIAHGQIIGTQIAVFNFFSDLDPGVPIISCSPPITNCLLETGGVQTAFQLFWSNGTVDTIQFQSDVPVPEPASWLLLLMGFVALGISKRCGSHREARK